MKAWVSASDFWYLFAGNKPPGSGRELAAYYAIESYGNSNQSLGSGLRDALWDRPCLIFRVGFRDKQVKKAVLVHKWGDLCLGSHKLQSVLFQYPANPEGHVRQMLIVSWCHTLISTNMQQYILLKTFFFIQLVNLYLLTNAHVLVAVLLSKCCNDFVWKPLFIT